jgi:hypothetical protein
MNFEQEGHCYLKIIVPMKIEDINAGNIGKNYGRMKLRRVGKKSLDR